MTDNIVEPFLRVFPGRAFCQACLAEMLHVPLPNIVSATSDLRPVMGFRRRRGYCDNCTERRLVCGFIESAA